MTSSTKCCGLWTAVFGSNKKNAGRVYRRTTYNEKEYSVEFENLIEEEDFLPPTQHVVSSFEKELLTRGRYDELLRHQNMLNQQQEELLRRHEENVKLEDEAYVEAKREAALMAKQNVKKSVPAIRNNTEIPDMSKLSKTEFLRWLSQESIDITSPEFNMEDFDTFLEKMKTKSQDKSQDTTTNANHKPITNRITQISDDTLQPVELYAVQTIDENNIPEKPLGQSAEKLFNNSTEKPLTHSEERGQVENSHNNKTITHLNFENENNHNKFETNRTSNSTILKNPSATSQKVSATSQNRSYVNENYSDSEEEEFGDEFVTASSSAGFDDVLI